MIRAGKTQRIISAEVVPGDLFILEEGERIAADGVLLSCQELSADESLLTGESVPVNKQVSTSETPSDKTIVPNGIYQSLVYSGSLTTVFRASTGWRFITDMLANLSLGTSERAER